MNLLTFEFWPFFLILLFLYYFLSFKFQNILLTLANVFFIASWGSHSLITLVVSMGLSYLVYLKIIDESTDHKVKKKFTYTFIALQITLLIYCKSSLPHLPLGISYYTFTIIAFLLEVLWKRTTTRLNALEYFISISYFPIIMMGPIERLSKFSLQLRTQRVITLDSFKNGLYPIALGLFKLTAIANPLETIINHNKNPALETYGFGLITYCFLAFMKLYAEFSGFINVVTGLSLFLGFQISKNFDQPYFATSVSDIWKRWHMSLTLWLRDFVFTPLVLKTKNIALSSVIVMFLVGAWHGMIIDFFYWSLYWIIFYILYLFYMKISMTRKSAFFFQWKSVKIAVTFIITCLSTLSFMIPYSGFSSLLSRLFSVSGESFFHFYNALKSMQVNLFFIISAILFMVFFESYDKNNLLKYRRIKIILLFFLIATLGEFKLHSLLYIRT